MGRAPSASGIVVDFATRTVAGTFTTRFNNGWDPVGAIARATLEPSEILPDGSFVAKAIVPGATTQGELRGRLVGQGGDALIVY